MNWIDYKDNPPTGDENRCILYQTVKGSKFVTTVFNAKSLDVIAWMELPEDYIPPKPERREVWCYFHANIPHAYEAEKQTVNSGGKFLEVFDGDVDPDFAIDLVTTIQKYVFASGTKILDKKFILMLKDMISINKQTKKENDNV